jgi:RNA polymerase sigma-70 factor (ECF subfamily)
LTRVFGPDNLDLAEDVVQETLVRALAQWPLGGVPANPAGWLYQAAKPPLNRAIALAERRGPRAGLEAIQSIPDQVLEGYYARSR